MAAKVRRRLDRLVAHTSVDYRPAQTVFAQGDRCGGVMFIRKGRVQLTATSANGRTAVVGDLRAGAFFGEGALAGQRIRRVTATTIIASTIVVVRTGEMRRGLHAAALADWFRSYLLDRNNSIEAALVEVLER